MSNNGVVLKIKQSQMQPGTNVSTSGSAGGPRNGSGQRKKVQSYSNFLVNNQKIGGSQFKQASPKKALPVAPGPKGEGDAIVVVAPAPEAAAVAPVKEEAVRAANFVRSYSAAFVSDILRR